MHGGAHDPVSGQSPARSSDRGPWAVALNRTAATDEISVTLLALAVVDDVLRISGIVRVEHRAEVRLLSVPTLLLAALDGPPLELIGAHARPTAHHVWVSWIYERPPGVPGEYEAQIDHIDLAWRAGHAVQEVIPGPWVFRFQVPDPGDPDTHPSTPASVDGA